ncbi:hypothetical protein CWR48_08520 [Oceanobacillus arenosus]|uniref:Uncharacterized protein n=2 Tax=Oceanobacillus arenosus TaxID=1229153 RepID=A0A3D8PSZ1_9BACI|nr:hypothetical protein CWR48_08520 [Oceanobacillus arenosus]
MASGILFYWFSWTLWIIATFFMKKNRLRTFLAAWILLSIIGSYVYLEIVTLTFSLSMIILLLGSIVLLTRNKHLFYHTFSAFTVMIGYAGFRFWEILSPILMFLPKGILITIIFSLLSSILANNFYSRLSICILGMLAGEWIYQMTVIPFGFMEIIGEPLFLDHLLSTILFISFISIAHRGSNVLVVTIRNLRERFRLQNQ